MFCDTYKIELFFDLSSAHALELQIHSKCRFVWNSRVFSGSVIQQCVFSTSVVVLEVQNAEVELWNLGEPAG